MSEGTTSFDMPDDPQAMNLSSKTSFYLWYLGCKSSEGLRGASYIRPRVEELLTETARGRAASSSRSSSYPVKVTLQVSVKGLKILPPPSDGAGGSRSSDWLRQFLPHNAITCVHQSESPNEDVVSVIAVAQNRQQEQTSGPLAVHTFRCDSSETADCLEQKLSLLVNRRENQDKWSQVEERLKEKQLQLEPRGSGSASKIGSDGRSLGRSSDSCSDIGPSAPADNIVSLHDSLAAELRLKLSKNTPLLLPPKDYDLNTLKHQKATVGKNLKKQPINDGLDLGKMERKGSSDSGSTYLKPLVSTKTYAERHAGEKKGYLETRLFRPQSGQGHKPERHVARAAPTVARRNSFHELQSKFESPYKAMEEKLGSEGNSHLNSSLRKRFQASSSSDDEADNTSQQSMEENVLNFLSSKAESDHVKQIERAGARPKSRTNVAPFDRAMEAVEEFEKVWPSSHQKGKPSSSSSRDRRINSDSVMASKRGISSPPATRPAADYRSENHHQLAAAAAPNHRRPRRRADSPEAALRRSSSRAGAGMTGEDKSGPFRVLRRERTVVFDNRYPAPEWHANPMMPRRPPTREELEYQNHLRMKREMPIMLHHQHPMHQAIIAPTIRVAGKKQMSKAAAPASAKKEADYSRYPGLDMSKKSSSQSAPGATPVQLKRSPSYGYQEWHAFMAHQQQPPPGSGQLLDPPGSRMRRGPHRMEGGQQRGNLSQRPQTKPHRLSRVTLYQ